MLLFYVSKIYLNYTCDDKYRMVIHYDTLLRVVIPNSLVYFHTRIYVKGNMANFTLILCLLGFSPCPANLKEIATTIFTVARYWFWERPFRKSQREL